jgi:hypothetical protein
VLGTAHEDVEEDVGVNGDHRSGLPACR